MHPLPTILLSTDGYILEINDLWECGDCEGAVIHDRFSFRGWSFIDASDLRVAERSKSIENNVVQNA